MKQGVDLDAVRREIPQGMLAPMSNDPSLVRYTVSGARHYEEAADIMSVLRGTSWPCTQLATYKRKGQTWLIVAANTAPHFTNIERTGQSMVTVRPASSADSHRPRTNRFTGKLVFPSESSEMETEIVEPEATVEPML